MSLHLFKSDVLFFQRILTVSGFYTGPLDGTWSPDYQLKTHLALKTVRAKFEDGVAYA